VHYSLPAAADQMRVIGSRPSRAGEPIQVDDQVSLEVDELLLVLVSLMARGRS
jgi:hypothetical protein